MTTLRKITLAACALSLLLVVFDQPWARGCLFVSILLTVIPVILYPTAKSRRDAEAHFRQTEKEIGLRPYTRIEARTLIQRERDIFNQRHREIALWTPYADDYIDYDGNVRDVHTDQIIRTTP